MKQVWVIDDDEEMGRAIGLMLKLLDCDTTLFLSARSAVQTLLTGKHPHQMIETPFSPFDEGMEHDLGVRL